MSQTFRGALTTLPCELEAQSLLHKRLCVRLFHAFVLDFSSPWCCAYFSGTLLEAPSGDYLFRNAFSNHQSYQIQKDMTIMTEYVDDELPLPPFAELFGEGMLPNKRKLKKFRENPQADETTG